MSVPELADILVETIDLNHADAAKQGGTDVPSRLPEVWTLSLDDLMPDEGREVVLTAPEDTAIEIASSAPVADAGVAAAHVTATGIDVEGLHYIHFDTGTILYYEGDLIITPV